MYITEATLNKLEQKYGVPSVLHTAYQMNAREFDLLKWSMRDGRAHDVTLFIFQGARVAVIRKPSYVPGLYRVPSGGIKPGECFEVGAKREAYEETGLDVELERYLLKVFVTFSFQGEVVTWTSHVFSAQAIGGHLQPVDTKEIDGARWATVDELKTTLLTSLQQSASAGLRYRAELQAKTIACMEER